MTTYQINTVNGRVGVAGNRKGREALRKTEWPTYRKIFILITIRACARLISDRNEKIPPSTPVSHQQALQNRTTMTC